MIRVVFGQLRHRLGRTLVLLLVILVATTSFTVLTGAAETTRLEVRGTVEQNFRSSYDLLVRPTGSYTAFEREQGLVRPNYQSGIFGGITGAQLTAIRAITGVDVAAPVANIGYVPLSGLVDVPVRSLVTGDRQQLFRIRPTWTADRGLSRFVGAPSYVYVSRNRTTVLRRVPYTRGVSNYREGPVYAEVVPGRRRPVPACSNYDVDLTGTQDESGRDAPFPYRERYAEAGAQRMSCFYTDLKRAPGAGDPQGAAGWSDLRAYIPVSLPVLVAAVDPDAEAQLAGLDRAVSAGRPLTAKDRVSIDDQGDTTIPALAATHVDLDESVSATIERVAPSAGGQLSDALTGERGVVDRVAALRGTKVADFGPVPSSQSYQTMLADGGYVNDYYTVGPSTYTRDGPALAVRPVPPLTTTYVSGRFVLELPVGADDRAFRPLEPRWLETTQDNLPHFDVVGRFNRNLIAGPGRLSGLTAETYVSPLLPGADAVSRRALGNQPLAPSSNLAGYAAQPPTVLTTLEGAAVLQSTLYHTSSPAPISVVRVRVSGIQGADPVSRERLNQAALAISHRTGLAVDIVAGASGVPTTVVLPAGAHGRPQLRLLEQWARKGVAYQVVDAVDRKSVALFLLILAVCALVVGNAASAAVRTRRIELGVLSCLGWRAGTLFGVVLLELAGVGLVAGLIGTALAWPLAAALGVAIAPTRAALAVPAAVLLATLAGLAPALRAARAVPMHAVRPLVWALRRRVRVRSVVGLARQGLKRVPGRTALAVMSSAIGVAGVTVLLGVQQTFSGLVVGSLLGDAVAVQVRAPDLAALVAIILLGAVGVADVLSGSVREQAAEFAALSATGWTDAALSRMVLAQGLVIGALGGVIGAGLGGTALAGFARSAGIGLLPPALLGVAAGVLVAAAAAIGPAQLIRRLPVATLLSNEE